MGIRELLDLPTLNIEILLDLKQSLTGRSFVHTPDVASRWESQRAAQFHAVHGLYRDADLIVKADNFDRFHFDFLVKENFSRFDIVFMKAKLGDDALKEHFIDLLNRGRKKAGLEPLTAKQRKRIEFRVLSEAECQLHGTVLSQLRLRDLPGVRDATPYDAYWSFQTHSGLRISFVGWLQNEEADNTRNLNLRASLQKAKQFRDLWEEADNTRNLNLRASLQKAKQFRDLWKDLDATHKG